MRLRLMFAPLVVLAVLLIGACATAPTSSPAGTVTGTPSVTPSPVASPTSPAATGAPGSPGSFAIPSFNADPALEAQIPNQINGVTLQKLSFRGEDFMTAGAATDPELAQLFERLGTSPENLSIAIGFDMTGSLDAGVLAIRVVGTDANRVIQELGNAARQQNAAATVTQRTVGGKTVTTITDPDDPSGAIHLYARGDVVFGVTGATATSTDQILAQLP